MGRLDVKVITGVRSGKLELLNMFIDYNLDKFDDLKQYKGLIKYVS